MYISEQLNTLQVYIVKRQPNPVTGSEDKETPARPKAEAVRKFFIERLSSHGRVYRACREVGTSAVMIYKYRKDVPGFAELWDAALEESSDRIILEARERALEGQDKGIWFNGQLVGTEKVKSDMLLGKLLAGADPKYRTTRSEVSNPIGENLKVEVDNIDIARRIAFLFSQAMRGQTEINPNKEQEKDND